MLPLNCGAVSASLIESELFGHERGSFTGANRRHRGFFERASGGTLFLDEITEMPVELQVRLLRVLETGSLLRVGGSTPVDVDVRVIAATNRDPARAVKDRVLREDLYYRLNAFPIQLPPLCDRGKDIELLATRFLEQLNKDEGTNKRFTSRALDLLVGYRWPGNVRELKNTVQRAFILAEDKIDVDCLPTLQGLAPEETTQDDYLRIRIGSRIEDAERRLLLATLRKAESKKQAAETLGISLKTLYNRLKSYEEEGEGEAQN
jgi:transcriptional regulator with PAS, ATPase and Fis domain